MGKTSIVLASLLLLAIGGMAQPIPAPATTSQATNLVVQDSYMSPARVGDFWNDVGIPFVLSNGGGTIASNSIAKNNGIGTNLTVYGTLTSTNFDSKIKSATNSVLATASNIFSIKGSAGGIVPAPATTSQATNLVTQDVYMSPARVGDFWYDVAIPYIAANGGGSGNSTNAIANNNGAGTNLTVYGGTFTNGTFYGNGVGLTNVTGTGGATNAIANLNGFGTNTTLVTLSSPVYATNLVVTGTLSPNVAGTYTNIANYGGEPAFERTDGAYYIWFLNAYYVLSTNASGVTPVSTNAWYSDFVTNPDTTYSPHGTNTGTATATYSIITNSFASTNINFSSTNGGTFIGSYYGDGGGLTNLPAALATNAISNNNGSGTNLTVYGTLASTNMLVQITNVATSVGGGVTLTQVTNVVTNVVQSATNNFGNTVPVNLTNGANAFTGAFTGNGAGLTNVTGGGGGIATLNGSGTNTTFWDTGIVGLGGTEGIRVRDTNSSSYLKAFYRDGCWAIGIGDINYPGFQFYTNGEASFYANSTPSSGQGSFFVTTNAARIRQNISGIDTDVLVVSNQIIYGNGGGLTNVTAGTTNLALMGGILPQYPTAQIATNAPFTNAVLTSPDGTNRAWSANLIVSDTVINGGLAIVNSNGATVIGDVSGNPRGQYAVDVQNFRNNTNQVASGQFATAVGEGCQAPGQYATALGAGDTAGAIATFAAGNTCVVSGAYGVGIGVFNNIYGYAAVGVGLYNQIYAQWATAVGAYNFIYGNYSSTLGYGVTNDVDYGVALGYNGVGLLIQSSSVQSYSDFIVANPNLSLGAEKVANGSFTNDLSSWGGGTTWAWGTNAALKNNATSTVLQQTNTDMISAPIPGEIYLFSFTETNMQTSVQLNFVIGGVTNQCYPLTNMTHTYNRIVKAVNNTGIQFVPNRTFHGSVTGVSLKKILAGNLAVAGNAFITGTNTAGIFIGNGSSLTNSAGNGFADATITNGLATTNYVNVATNNFGNTVAVTMTNAANQFAGTFTNGTYYGNGGGLTNLQSTNIVGLVAGSGITNGQTGVLLAGTFTNTSTFYGNSLTLPVTTSNIIGVIRQGGSPIFHTYGPRNLYVGQSAGSFKLYGQQDNSGFGYKTLENITSGSNNAAVGSFAQDQNGNGNFNSSFGTASLSLNVGGNSNSAFGYYALANVMSGNNIGIGAGAGYNIIGGGNNIDIGNMGSNSDDSITRIGDVQTDAYIAGIIHGDGTGLTNLTSIIQQGSTNAVTLTAFTATFSRAFADTNYTAVAIGNGFALASSYVSAKTTTNCVFNMTIATGNIDWMAVHQ